MFDNLNASCILHKIYSFSASVDKMSHCVFPINTILKKSNKKCIKNSSSIYYSENTYMEVLVFMKDIDSEL